MAQTVTHRDSFILRIWREGESKAWKGWVQHASSGRAAPVNSPAQLLAFIEQYSDRDAFDADDFEGWLSPREEPGSGLK